MTLFQQRYRVQSKRIPKWDYTSAGYYFVTICTKDRMQFFGKILDGKMRLSSVGRTIASEWKGIEIRRRHVQLDEWVVIPNHLHGIIVLKDDTPVETPHRQRNGIMLSNDRAYAHMGTDMRSQRGVSTTSRLRAGSLGAIIGQFKSRTTKRIWREGFRDFGWQARFYDHIVRNQESLNQIRQYIADNPLKWELDKDNVENLYMQPEEIT